MAAHAVFGPVYAEERWAPAPRYLMRRDRILRWLKKAAPGKTLEIGPACGALLSELDDLGFSCTGLETGAEALEKARRLHAGRDILWRDSPDADWREAFDYCIACEVLEHIEDDRAALRQWTEWLKPGGHMVLSVPAHPSLWNRRDEWAGHFRRYTREGLRDVFAEAGLAPLSIECYGFIAAVLIEQARALAHPLRPAHVSESDYRSARSAASGIDRETECRVFDLYASIPGRWLMQAAIAAQAPFVETGIGNGYLVFAHKPAT